MNVSVINNLGLSPLQALLGRYGSWPLLDDSWTGSNYQWEIVEARLGRDLGVESFFSASLVEDMRNSSKLVITVTKR